MTTHYCYTESPFGRLLLVGDFQGLSLINFQDGAEPVLPEAHWRKDAAFFVNAIVQLKEYFAGNRQRFSLRLNPKGSEFQREVLAAVARIPYGETATYSDIARIVGKPKSVRAVGSANRTNPIPIMVPCHRVLGSNGKVTGVTGDLEMKQWLLDLEAGRLTVGSADVSAADIMPKGDKSQILAVESA